jgi:hypothetical protein
MPGIDWRWCGGTPGTVAKKAKRRGRPSVSENNGTMAKAGNFAKMEVAQLRDHIAHLQGVLSKKIGEQRTALERQLAALGGGD